MRLIDADALNGYELGLISPKAQKLFHKIINDAPTQKTACRMSEWIPVSQPPEKSGKYIVSMRYVTHDVVAIASYATDLHRVDEYDFPKHEAGWYNYDSEYGYYKIENVIVAYMPLPLPYKQEVGE